MLFTWLKRRRRARILESPFPDDWLAHLESNVVHYRYLDPARQARLRDDLRIFAAEKNWEGCAGLALTDEIKVTIAALACLLVLGREHDYFERVLSILVYPTSFAVPERRAVENWTVEGEAELLGQAWYRGPVILSWAEVRRDARRSGRGRNVVWHEFAHQLDMLDRAVDGTPPLDNREQYRRWGEVMTTEFEQLIQAAETGRRTLLDQYGATNEGEFFAVATECFFDRPAALRREHPRLYELLSEYYRQDPAERVPDEVRRVE